LALKSGVLNRTGQASPVFSGAAHHTMVNFANLDSDKGLNELNQYLADRSYVDGYQPSQADVSALKQVGKAPDAQKYAYVSRWFSHISSFADEERAKFRVPSASAPKAETKEDDIDLFGDDDEDDEEYERQLEERRKAAEAAKGAAKKDKPVAKSSVVLDVKPWDDETPMEELEKCVRSIVVEGLVWGQSKLVPVGYGIKKLQIGAVVVDDLVSIEDLEEQITAFSDYVQSMDVAAFNKI